jgi:hypothetical protein
MTLGESLHGGEMGISQQLPDAERSCPQRALSGPVAPRCSESGKISSECAVTRSEYGLPPAESVNTRRLIITDAKSDGRLARLQSAGVLFSRKGVCSQSSEGSTHHSFRVRR